jgi:hypothetical protein
MKNQKIEQLKKVKNEQKRTDFLVKKIAEVKKNEFDNQLMITDDLNEMIVVEPIIL